MPSDEEVTTRAGSVRVMTGFTDQEFQALLPPFEHAFVAYLRDRTVDGHPRASRRDRTDDHGPLPTMADKRLFMLTDFKQHPIPGVQGQLFGMSPSHANHWIHLRHAVLNQALAPQEWLPPRTADDVAAMFATARAADVPIPLVGMMVPSAQSTAQPIQRHNRTPPAARSKATRSTTSS